MIAELQIMVTVGGRPIWMKKKEIPSELTKRLTDAQYQAILDGAEEKLDVLVLASSVTPKGLAEPAKKRK